jgi:FMN phosphatase YigB (HAD superfamily)
MSLSQVVLFDIDLTLINTDWLRGEISKNIQQEFAIDQREFEDSELRYLRHLKKTSDFRYSEYLVCLAKTFNLNLQKLMTVFTRQKYYRQAVYPDVNTTLRALLAKG